MNIRPESLTAWIKIALSLLLAMMLTILPLPLWASVLQPAWVLMVLFFWIFAESGRIGLMLVWVLGILLDLLTGTVLGQHTFPLLIVSYFLLRFRPQIAILSCVQQSLTVFLLITLYYGIQYGIVALDLGRAFFSWIVCLPLLTSLLLWFMVYKLLQRCEHHLHQW